MQQGLETQAGFATPGDYKLKSDPAYIAPEEERLTLHRKRQHILLFDYAVHTITSAFNAKV